MGMVGKRGLVVCLFGGLLGLLLVSGCGKVTQVSNPSGEVMTLDIMGQFPITPTPNLSTSRFLLSESPFYVSVHGVKPNGQTDELSWGKLTISSMGSPMNTTVLKAISMRRGDIVIDRASAAWAYLTLNANQTGVQVEVRRLKRGYAYYVLVAYNRTGRALMTTVLGDSAGIPTVNIQQWSVASTVRTGVLMRGMQSSMARDTLPRLETLERLLPDRVVMALEASLVTPSVTAFNPDLPTLAYWGEREHALLAVATLLEAGDSDGALQRLAQFRQEGLLAAGGDVLARHIQSLPR